MIRGPLFLITLLLLATAALAGPPDRPSDWVEVRALHPTQFTVGMKYVAEKEEQVSKMSKSDRHEYLRTHPIPAVRGFDGELYMIDHHHLARAVQDAGFNHVFVTVLHDWSGLGLTRDEFWHRMETSGFVYLHDGHNRMRSVTSLPGNVDSLQDDPYRALAGEVRDLGGFRKTPVPFTEFKWADYFRTRVSRELLETHWKRAIEEAMKLSNLPDARDLPGYIGLTTCQGLF